MPIGLAALAKVLEVGVLRLGLVKDAHAGSVLPDSTGIAAYPELTGRLVCEPESASEANRKRGAEGVLTVSATDAARVARVLLFWLHVLIVIVGCGFGGDDGVERG